MAKYRRLSQEEFENLEQEFITYLSGNSVTADEWVKLKEDKSPRVDHLLDEFSDLVMERALKKIEYLEMLSSKEIRLFKLEEGSARMVGLSLKKGDYDLRDNAQIKKLFIDLSSGAANAEVFQLEKEYSKERAEEAFFLIKNGAMVSDDLLYKQIDMLIQ